MAKNNHPAAPVSGDPTTPQAQQTAEAVNPETPEGVAFALMRLALPLDPAGRQDLLGLFAECLTVTSGQRRNIEWKH